MNTVEHVRIKNLWLEQNFDIDFKEDVAFLIGENGTGKTTIINLIAAALTADYDTLDETPFESIVIKLSSTEDRKKPEIKITKTLDKRLPFAEIDYIIKDATTADSVHYSLDELERHLHIHDTRRYSSPARAAKAANLRARRISATRHRSEQRSSVKEHLSNLVNVSWLSVHRDAGGRDSRSAEEYSYSSSVDRKLNSLSDRLVRYFSQLGKRGTDMVFAFQKNIFLALLADQNFQMDLPSEGNSTIEDEKNSLSEIFEEFGLSESEYKKKLDHHFSLYREAKTKNHYGSSEVAALVLTKRIHSLVEGWQEMRARERKIYEPREVFLEAINRMLRRKKLAINDRNELVVEKESANQILPLLSLSSGEKQLVIILGEALLQRNRTCIYIADEPELSLHVAWQQALVGNIRNVNPDIQLLVATHSPDITGDFPENINDMAQFFESQ